MNLQRLFHFNTMREKVLIPILFLMILMMGGLGAMMGMKNDKALQAMNDAAGNEVSTLLSGIGRLYLGDPPALEDLIRKSLLDPNIVFAVFYDNKNMPLTGTSMVPKDQSALLVYEREIPDETGQILGYLKLGYRREIPSQVNQSLSRELIISILVAITFLVIGVNALFRRTNRPFMQLVDVVEKVAQGDLTVQMESELAVTRDEVGVLGQAFFKMSAGLKGVIKRIQDVSQEITSVADQISDNTRRLRQGAVHQAGSTEKTSNSVEEMNTSVKNIAESVESLSGSAQSTATSLGEMSTAISQVVSSTRTLSSSVEETVSSLQDMSTSISQMAENTESLAMTADETASSISQMNGSIKEVGHNAKESAQLTEKVSREAAELGMGAIEKTIQGMDKIRQAVEQSSEVIIKLNKRSEQIGKVLTIIEEVTRKTNLLALNAAILAAQAGDEGKGFSVVGDEIKNLADRTAASTQEIAQLIRDVQVEAKDAVTKTREGIDSVEEGSRLSMEARESFSKILERSRRSSEMSRQIENATIEQVSATGHVAQLMEKVNLVVKQINFGMKDLEKGIGQIMSSSEKMKANTLQVKASTEEQERGSRQIRHAVENVTQRIQQIAHAINEQKHGDEVIGKAIVEIHQITQLSVKMVGEMNHAVEGLTIQANLLKGEVQHFKI
ncbi:MAG: methyl-accepting chemotaxis protein [Nitrospiria bacterium]